MTEATQRQIDPLMEAAHKGDANFRHYATMDPPPEVVARGYANFYSWRQPRVTPADHEGYPQRDPGRKCGYCGSLHPEDLAGFIQRGEVESAELADQKYGYPHKVYVTLPNPLAGVPTVRSWSSEMVDGRNTGRSIPGPATPEPSHWQNKFYLRHLAGVGEPTFTVIRDWLQKTTGYRFEMREDGLFYCRIAWPGECVIQAVTGGVR